VTLTGAVQLSYKRYKLLNDRFKNYYEQRVAHTTDYTFLSPRVGVTVRPVERLSVFGSLSYNEQEPTNDEIFDPQDYWADATAFFGKTTTLADGSIIGEDPLMNPEQLLDLELGVGFEDRHWRAEANLYFMRFDDEIVYNGQINDDGVPIRANAPRSTHQGIELSAQARLESGFSVAGNLSLNDNTFDEFDEFVMDWNTWEVDTVSRVGNTIGGFPKHLANLRIGYDHRNFSVSGHVFSAGRLYIDNSNDKAASIAPYEVVNLSGELKLESILNYPGLTFFIHLNNVLDEEYETGGYFDDGFPLFIPAAKRNVFAGLRATL
jgi:iron complex outermembrane receptor protein